MQCRLCAVAVERSSSARVVCDAVSDWDICVGMWGNCWAMWQLVQLTEIALQLSRAKKPPVSSE